MAKKYVATIMNRTYMGDGAFIYLVSHPEIGELDVKTGIFKDRNDREYAPINDACLMMSEISDGYYNLTELDKIQEIMGTDSKQDAIKDYYYYTSRNIYVVTKTREGIPLVLVNNIDVMRNQASDELEAREKLNIDASENPNYETYDSIEDNTIDTTNEDNDVFIDLDEILIKMIEGKYSIEELKKLKDVIQAQKDDYEGVLDSITLQIEATEKGESSTILKEAIEKGKGKVIEKKEEMIEEDSSKNIRNASKKIKNYIDINKVFAQVTETLISQDNAAKRVLTEIARKEQSEASKARAILVTGPTGVGKTKMMELIAKYINKPFYKIDSTQLTIPGYVGKDIEEELWNLYVKYGKDKEKIEKAIIFFDEIDKKGSSKKDDISGQGVLNVLLPFIEGSTYTASDNLKKPTETVNINTKNMIVVLAGAYTEVYDKKTNKAKMGFGEEKEKEEQRKVTTEDFVKKGLMPEELMGRVSIVNLNELDIEGIKKILLESNESAIKIQKQIFEELGVKLTFTDEYINKISKMAIDRKTGARGVNNIVDETTWEAYGDAYTNLGEYEEIILDEETIENPHEYQKVLKQNKN